MRQQLEKAAETAFAVAAQAFGEAASQYPRAAFVPDAEFQRARSLEELYAVEGLPDVLEPGANATQYPSSVV